MTDLQLHGQLLTASVEDRILNYRLLPFGEEGYPSTGKLTVEAGTLTIPADISQLPINMEHDYKRPVGRFVSITETEEGINASVRIAKTSEGDDALILAAEGLRTGISVEISDYVIRAGKLIKGILAGAGLVVYPAFESAQLAVASDHGDLEEELSESNRDTESNEMPNEEKETLMAENNEVVPDGRLNANNSGSKLEFNPETVARFFAEEGKAGAQKMEAAFALQTFQPTYDVTHQPQWLGEVWSKRAYTRRFVPLLQQGTLTSWRAEGFRITNLPTVAPWAGAPAEVHSSTASVEVVTSEANNLAGGYSLDRRYLDLGSASFIDVMYRGAVEDYARKTDAIALAQIIDAAGETTPVAAPVGEVDVLDSVLVGARQLLSTDRSPSFALVPADSYYEMALSRGADNRLNYLNNTASLTEGNVAGFRVIPVAGLENVIVGTSDAATFYELAGVVRVSALDIQHGIVSEAVHGYWAFLLNDEGGFVQVGGDSGEGE